VADRERAREWDCAADVPDRRVDQARPEAGVHRPRDMTVDRERVAVAAADDDRADDRVVGGLDPRFRSLEPLEPALRDEIQLAHGSTL
jgi:hypothetical protein